jgi:hypothetical protein
MSDTITVDEKTYVTSKKAAGMTSYTQDYIGQLARGGQIDAQRVGGLWYVNIESLQAYKSLPREESSRLGDAKPLALETDSLLSFDGNDYVSAARASEICGYNQDYVGQLARSGKVLSRRIGNRWYVERAGLIKHKTEKDALLAAVQKQSVGLQPVVEEPAENPKIDAKEPFFTYASDPAALFPKIMERTTPRSVTVEPEISITDMAETTDPEIAQIPIRVISAVRKPVVAAPMYRSRVLPPKKRSNSRNLGILAASALTVVIVLSIGLYTVGRNATYAAAPRAAFSAAARTGATRIGDILEKILSPELIYRRAE